MCANGVRRTRTPSIRCPRSRRSVPTGNVAARRCPTAVSQYFDRGRQLLAGHALAIRFSLERSQMAVPAFRCRLPLVKRTPRRSSGLHLDPDTLQDTNGLEQVNFADRGYQLTRSSGPESVDVDPDVRPSASAKASRGHRTGRAGRGARSTRRSGLELLSAIVTRRPMLPLATGRSAIGRRRVGGMNKSRQWRQ